MAPTRTFSNWNIRDTDNRDQVDPYCKYYFICEGANTETWYFKKLIEFSKELGIHATIEVILLEKTGKDKDISTPKKLIEFADGQKKKYDFDEDHDKMVVVFDADVFESELDYYDNLVAISEANNILAVTNPSFELFLLLHKQNSLEEIILPQKQAILENKKEGAQRFVCKLCSQTFNKNPKSNKKIGELARLVKIAIAQERGINQDIHNCKGQLTSNIGVILNELIDNKIACI